MLERLLYKTIYKTEVHVDVYVPPGVIYNCNTHTWTIHQEEVFLGPRALDLYDFRFSAFI